MITFVNPLDTSYVTAVFYDPGEDSEFITWPVKGTDTIAAVLREGSSYMVSVKSYEDETIAFWNGIENSWEMIEQERLTELRESRDPDYCVNIEGGSITELGE